MSATHVEISETLIKRLQGLGPHFCRVYSQQQKHPDPAQPWQKRPVGMNWQQQLMDANDPRLQEWLGKGGNYGVVGGFGLVIIDLDHEELKQLVKEKLPPTFTVQSPGSHGWHLYYLASFEKPIRLRDKDGVNIGDIQGQGKMVVGTGSIHPNGGIYQVITDRPLAQVTRKQIIDAFKEFVVPDREIERVEATAYQERRKTKVDLGILQVVPLGRLHKRGSEYFGPHPVHGSKTGQNFRVNPSKNCWHCFRHGSGGGPLLWLAVEEGIIDCSEAGSGALRGDVFKRVLQKAIERGLLKETTFHQLDKKPVFLGHLNMIEDPGLAGKPVIVEAVVSSTSIAYLAPTEVKATFEDKDGNVVNSTEEIDRKSPVNIKLVGVNEDIKYRRLRRLFGTVKDIKVKETAWRTIYRVRVRPPVFTLEKRGEKIVDERGFEYKAYDIYITADKPITFQPSSIIRFAGICVPNPKTQKTTVLAYNITFPEEAYAFDVEKLTQLKNKLASMTVHERVNWILDNFEIYSQIVGRQNLAKAVLLCRFTPRWIKFNGDIQKGWGNILVVGDTTTAKTETIRKIISLLKAGMLITAETASTVGLTGTATQVEKEGWYVDWGFLVLMDGKSLDIDGAHKLSLSNWAALAEAERSGVVAIAKAAKDSAYARTRQVKVANAVDRDADKYATQSLANFLYPCQALTSILDKTSIARLDLAVFADQRDVKAEEINVKFKGDYDEELELLREALKWCWSNTAKIQFTDEAVRLLLKEATSLYNAFFCESVPLASIDMKWKLARLSASTAFLTLSTEDFSTVIVTEEHVKEVVEFLKNEYVKAGLNTLAQEERFEILSLEDVNQIIDRIIEASKGNLKREMVKNVFKFIVLQGRVTRDRLKTKFGLTETNQLRPLLAVLSNEKMVRAGNGLYPTPRLVQAYKILNVIKVNKVINPGEEPLKKSESSSEKIRGFAPDLDNHDNLDKKTIKSVEPLGKDAYEGTCAGKCGEKRVLYWHVTDIEGKWGDICQDCAGPLLAKKGDVYAGVVGKR